MRTEPARLQPSRSSRARLHGWLWLLVAVQIAVPASYYLREDRDDERFAWRMFSTVRLTRCEVAAFEQRQEGLEPVTLPHALHASWIRALERGRQRVIRRFLELRCADDAVRAAQLSRRCEAPSGARLPERIYRFRCADGAFEQTP